MNKCKIVNIVGVNDTKSIPIFLETSEKKVGPTLIITSSDYRANKLKVDLSFFSFKKIYIVPEKKEKFLNYQAKDHYDTSEIIKVLEALNNRENCYVIASIKSFMELLPPPDVFQKFKLSINRGNELDINIIKKELIELGYVRESLVHEKGEFSVRGSIIDIFPINSSVPFRIELFDTEVETIRSFDVNSQRKIEEIEQIEIYMAEMIPQVDQIFEFAYSRLQNEYDKEINEKEDKNKGILEERKNILLEYISTKSNIELLNNYIHYFYENNHSLVDYFKSDDSIFIENIDKINETIKTIEKETTNDFNIMKNEFSVIEKDKNSFVFKKSAFYKYIKNKFQEIHFSTLFKKEIKEFDEYDNFVIQNVICKDIPNLNGDIAEFGRVIKNYVKENYVINIICSSKERCSSLKEYISENKIIGKIYVKEGEINESMDFPEKNICYIWESTIFQNIKKKSLGGKRGKSSKQNFFSDLKKGDYVIHENHGVGKFIDIKQLEVQGIKKDYLQIKYAGNDLLYVPADQMNLIQKYIGADGITPKLNKMSSAEWKNTKAKAKVDIEDMAKELLELSAKRQEKKGYAFSIDDSWQKDFENDFPYQETEDQKRCIEEIKEDMEKNIAMERLLCGDVGYGKTEVAARAIFKCLADSKQAAVLVPTTILANQHYLTLKKRFEKFPFTVDVLSRFKTPKEIKTAIEKTKNGEIDLLIGTHRLLSKDVEFKDLGLLVIDEEQRFGVKHKESLKKLKENIDVLTLSATPIPRTLHMSLIGIRNMSLIEEPPAERFPVQTYVFEEDESLIRKAIEKEVSRGGQVYVIYNRVAGIDGVGKKIQKLVPEAKVKVAHGQMNEHELEKIMMSFINNESNVLVGTTILESGIDIPNANTIIMLDADKLGLSQLYQLRGRVGRSNKIAYAYLMFKKNKILSEASEKRLKAIKEFTEFGAGFRISMKDLEIRGAGNLLGAKQHGHMLAIGYELYCKLVENAVKKISSEESCITREEVQLELNETAYIPDSYIDDEIVKLQTYKKIAETTLENEKDLIIELKDRFGKIPKEVDTLSKLSIIRKKAENLSIEKINIKNARLNIYFRNKDYLKPEKYLSIVNKFGNNVKIQGSNKPVLVFDYEKCNKNKKLDNLREILNILQ